MSLEKNEFIEPRSKLRDGHLFWLSTTRPSKISICVAGILGSILDPTPTLKSAFGSSDPMVSIPLGLWYLNERPTTLILWDIKALAKVSPL